MHLQKILLSVIMLRFNFFFTAKQGTWVHKDDRGPCAPLLADIFLYSYEAEFIQSLLSTGKKNVASQFNFTYRYIDDVLSINKPDFDNYLGQMYPAELDQRHDGEQHLCFLLGFTPVDREWQSAAHFPLQQTWRFQLPYHKLSVPE